MTHLLEIKNLRTHFYTQGRIIKAVDGVSYHVDSGETLAIVGESGCGKSVTALSIMGLIPWPPGKIISGEILYQGQDLLKMNPEALRQIRGKNISMVFQEPMTSLNPVLTIQRQLTETLEAHSQITPEKSRVRALEVLNQVGISDPERRLIQYPHQLSGGMRQRIMIAAALICKPSLILADEPTTALDVTIQAQILALMKELSTVYKASMVLITHNLGVVARYADRVNVMYAGQVVEQGSAMQIYREPKHPYTLGLLKSVPRLDEIKGQRLEPIEGQPPDLGANIPGCKFLPRCPFGDPDTCGKDIPDLMDVMPGHRSACYKFKDLPPPAFAA
ncbi:MAG: ABC transporter ATP-binding protein [Deltaproteobacteria bacterium]|nr:ABC transporter ATP-binding protein [Deltaproteobacteria bacterium]